MVIIKWFSHNVYHGITVKDSNNFLNESFKNLIKMFMFINI